MIKKIIKFSLLFSFFYSSLYATITNFTLSKDTTLSNEMLSYFYESNKDTVFNEVWLEITDDTILTQEDKLIFSFAMVDNNTRQQFENGLLIIPDNDPAPQKYQFGPMVTNLPSARFYLVLKEGDVSCYKSFIIISPIPKIKIKGKVNVPQDFSCKNIWVAGYVKNGEKVFQALTNSMGEYTLDIDSETVANYESISVEINKEMLKIPSLVSVPSRITLSLKEGDIDSVNFSLVKANSFIKGRVTDLTTNDPIQGIFVELSDLNYNKFGFTTTDNGGNYIIGVDSGSYRVGVYCPNSENGYMNPPETLLTVGRNDTQIVDFKLLKCDTFFYVGILKDGIPYSGNFGIEAISKDKKLITYSNISGTISKVYVVKNNKYDISLQIGWERDTIPPGYILENHRIMDVSPGDTVYFYFVRGLCVIKGKIKDSSGMRVDTLGNIWGISNCIITLTEVLPQGGRGKEYISQPNSDGSYMCYVLPGTYNFKIDFINKSKADYMSHAYTLPITVNLGDTIEKNITLLPKDTFVYVHMRYNGAKTRLRLLMSVVSECGQTPLSSEIYETSQDIFIDDSLGSKDVVFPIRVSKYLPQYKIYILFGVKGYDSLAVGDIIKGGNLKSVTVGDTVVFEIYNSSVKISPYDSKSLLFNITNIKRINEKLLLTFTLPVKTNVSFQIYDIRGKEIAFIKDRNYDKGRYTISLNSPHIPTGYYVIKMKWNNGQIIKKISLIK